MCKLCVYKSFNHALLESKISGTMSFAQWWVLDLTLEPLPGAALYSLQSISELPQAQLRLCRLY